MNAVIILPSLKISGGTREALRLTADLNQHGCPASLLSMWVSPRPMVTNLPVDHLSEWPTRAWRAAFDLPVLALQFIRWKRNSVIRSNIFVFTHYSTLPLAFFVPRNQRFFFVQGIEWKFITNRLLTWFFRHIIIGIYQTGNVISTNSYLSKQLSSEGLNISLETPIWADPNFLGPDSPIQNIEFVMVLVKARIKRLDLYLAFIALAKLRGQRIAVITPEEEIATPLLHYVEEVLLRPTIEEMRDLYSRSVCFIHLSDVEGFGLSPLESMGTGCIPVCRDSGGVQAFMLDSPFSDLVLPLSMPISEVFARALAVVKDSARGKYRTPARDHFQQGLVRCALSRTRLLDAMLKMGN